MIRAMSAIVIVIATAATAISILTRFLDGIELPRGLDREVVLDGDERYELNGDDSRTIGAVGALRVVAERDLQGRHDENDARDPDRRHLRNQALIQSVKLHGRDRAVTLTERAGVLLLHTAPRCSLRRVPTPSR